MIFVCHRCICLYKPQYLHRHFLFPQGEPFTSLCFFMFSKEYMQLFVSCQDRWLGSKTFDKKDFLRSIYFVWAFILLITTWRIVNLLAKNWDLANNPVTSRMIQNKANFATTSRASKCSCLWNFYVISFIFEEEVQSRKFQCIFLKMKF